MADGARVTARAARSAAGLLLAAAAVLWLLSQVSGIVIPLVLAAVLGALFAPVVERLRGVGLPRSVGAALEGLPGVLGGVLGGAASFLIGLVIAVFLLYYVLVDWDGLRRWVGAHLGLAPDVGASAVDDAVDSVRRYFWSLTLSAVVTAVLIGGTAWALGVPLAFTIAVITLTTSYVPYLGATLATPATAAALLVHRRLASTGPESSPAAEDDAPEPAAG